MFGHAETEEEAKRLAGRGGLYWKGEDMKKAAKFSFFFCLAIGLIVFAVLIHFDPAFAQDKPSAVAPVAPVLSETAKLAIVKAQLKQKQLEAEFLSKQQEIASLQQQMANLSTQYKEGGKAFQDMIDAAYKDAKLDKKEWNLDLNTLEFTAIPKPIAPAAPQTVGSSQEPKKP